MESNYELRTNKRTGETRLEVKGFAELFAEDETEPVRENEKDGDR